MYEKLNSSRIVAKAAESQFAWICSLSQTSWLGSRKSAMIHFNRPLVFAPMVFLLCILIRILYSEENHRYHLPITTSQYMRRRLILSVRCILSAPKYMTKKKCRRRKNQESMGMNLCSFSAAQKVCSKLENQEKCDSAVFVTNPLKIHFSHTFWLPEVPIIDRTNYNCKIARTAIVPSLLWGRQYLAWPLIFWHFDDWYIRQHKTYCVENKTHLTHN